MSPRAADTTLTLFVDPDAKGRAADVGQVYLHGAWVALVRPEGGVIRRYTFADATDRKSAEFLLRKQLGIPKRKLTWEPTSKAKRAWTTRTRLG